METAKIVLVMGKGGVGKTTIARGIASGLSGRGLRCVVVELGTGAATRSHADSGSGAVQQTISEEEALLDTASEVFGSKSVAKLLLGNFAVKRLVSVIPGVREYCLVVAARARLADFERVVIDMPSTGHGIAWLSAAAQLARLVPQGRARAQADALDAALRDPRETSYVLVTLPEPMVQAESDELEHALITRLGVHVNHTVLNRVPCETDLHDEDVRALAHSDPSMVSPLAELMVWANERGGALERARGLLAGGRASVVADRGRGPSPQTVRLALGFAGSAR